MSEYYGNKKIDRLLYVDDVLYTISNSGYSAYSLSDFSKLNTIELKR